MGEMLASLLEKLVTSRTPGEAIAIIVIALLVVFMSGFGWKVADAVTAPHATEAAVAQMATRYDGKIQGLEGSIRAVQLTTSTIQNTLLEQQIFDNRLSQCRSETPAERALYGERVQRYLAEWRELHNGQAAYPLPNCEDLQR